MSKKFKSRPTMAEAMTDKERRLIAQNQAELTRLAKFRSEAFRFNRFGPLLFMLSFGVIGVYFAVMSFAATPAAENRQASLTIEPADRSVRKGQTMVVRVWSNSLEQPVSAVQTILDFPADSLEVVAIDAAASGFDQQDGQQIDNGRLRLDRSTTDPSGLSGRQFIAKVSFRAKTNALTGPADIHFAADSQLLRAGDKANILRHTAGSQHMVSLLVFRP